MAKKVIDTEQLRKLTALGKKVAESDARKGHREYENRKNKEARAMASNIIAELPKRIEEAAKSGEDELVVFTSDQVQSYDFDRVSLVILSWCQANGLTTRKVDSHTTEDALFVPTKLYVSWRKT